MENEADSIANDIRQWAYDADAPEPQQDFDLFLAMELRKAYFDFVSDITCPKQKYFLKVLYLIVGDAVRTEYHTNTREEINEFLEAANKLQVKELELWIDKSRNLMKHPEKFDYDRWCGGGLVGE